MASTRPRIDLELLLSTKYDQKWEVLRPFIEHVYIEEDAKMALVKDIVKSEFNFDAKSVTSALLIMSLKILIA